MEKNDEVRDQVKEVYSTALKSGTGCCEFKSSKGVLAKRQGEYSEKELRQIPSDSVENSFGCGNPFNFANVKEGDVVLDLGSGAGIDILIAASKVGEKGKVIGVDMTPDMIQRANENIKKSGYKNVEVKQGTIESLPLEDGSIDVVISNCVINLSPEKEKVFSEIFRVLKYGGKMLVSDIVAEDIPDKVRQIPQIYNTCIGGAVSEKKYIEMVKNAGMKNVEVKAKFVYDSATVKDLLFSEQTYKRCGCGNEDKIIEHSVSFIENKVASVNVYAEKI
jgi:SAM-dependent methyltransferase